MTITPGPYLLIGSYTGGVEPLTGDGLGVHLVAYDESGRLTPVSVVPVADPSYVAYDAERGVLYSVVEQEAGRVASAFFTPENGWSGLAAGTSAAGEDPCHLVVHPDGGHLFVANYSSGSLAVFPIDEDGRVSATKPSQLIEHVGSGPNEKRQLGPHAHHAAVSPDGRFVLCTDLGTDSVFVYSYDAASGKLSLRDQVRFIPGSGPRHLEFHGSGRFVYVLNELSSMIVVCTYDAAAGLLVPGAEQTVRRDPASPVIDYPAAVRISADDRFVYVSVREDDDITIFAVEDDGASLRRLDIIPCGGSWPRDIVLSPDGKLLFAANQKSDAITVFHVDAKSGLLSSAGEPFTVPAPASVLPLPVRRL
jgi:6-phosphogluconolactonase